MKMEYRDYLQTVDKILDVYSIDFWEEELCYILNGDRNIQINFQGNATEYLKDLLIKSKNYNLQEVLLKKAIQNFVKNYRFVRFSDNIEDDAKADEFITLINITREFCGNDESTIKYYTNFIIVLSKSKLFSRKKYLDLDSIKSIFTGVLYMVRDFLPTIFDFKSIKKGIFSEYQFLNSYFLTIESFLQFDEYYLKNSIIFLGSCMYPINYSKNVVKNILSNENILESIIYEYRDKPNAFKEVISELYKSDLEEIMLQKITLLNDEYLLKNFLKIKYKAQKDIQSDIYSNSNYHMNKINIDTYRGNLSASMNKPFLLLASSQQSSKNKNNGKSSN